MSSKRTQQFPKMKSGKDQIPENITMDVFNAPKVQYVNINIGSLHLHESEQKTSARNWTSLIAVFIAMFVCLLIAITFLLSREFPSSSNHLTLTQSSNKFQAQNLIKIVERHEWCQIKSIQGKKKLSLPVPKAIIMQTFTKECLTKDQCKEYLLKKQNKDYPKVDDIKENFFVGVDGTIYEGRGFAREGEHTYDRHGTSYNKDSIGISFIGDYRKSPPSQNQIESILSFFTQSIQEGKLDSNYSIYYETQLTGQSDENDQLFKTIKSFQHWNSNLKTWNVLS